jgi:hypothetical protein
MLNVDWREYRESPGRGHASQVTVLTYHVRSSSREYVTSVNE